MQKLLLANKQGIRKVFV